jgi:hypothetical protein
VSAWILAGLPWACAPEAVVVPVPEIAVEEPVLYAPSPDRTPLAWRFEVSASEPVHLDLTVTSASGTNTIASDGPWDFHALPVLGLRPGQWVQVAYRVTDNLDRLLLSGELDLETPPLPERFPLFEILAHDPARMEPGHLLLDIKVPKDNGAKDPPEQMAYLVVLDEQLEVVWYFHAPDKIGAVTLTQDHLLMGLMNGNAVLWDWFGQRVETWYSNPDTTSSIAVDALDFHHEVLPQADGGFWTLSYQATTVDAYPTSYADPTLLGEETLIDDSLILHVQADGSLSQAWAMAERLDTTRIGYDSLDKISNQRWDWGHANALTLDPTDGGVLVSMRHQDAIAKLSAQGELLWILASPAGWRDSFQEKLLTPIGELAWPYHQHSPRLTDDGTLLVFDNGNNGRNPYESEPTDDTTNSRVVAYRIDPDRMTVEQLWEYQDTLTGPLYASALCGVDPLSETGNVWVSYGFLDSELGVSNREAERGEKSIRLIQFHPDNPDFPVVDLRLGSRIDAEPMGWKSYRAEPIPRMQDLRPR